MHQPRRAVPMTCFDCGAFFDHRTRDCPRTAPSSVFLSLCSIALSAEFHPFYDLDSMDFGLLLDSFIFVVCNAFTFTSVIDQVEC